MRQINADAAMNRLEKRKREVTTRDMAVIEKNGRMDEINKCMEVLHRLPYADAKPVRHGRNVSPAHYSDEFTCSACGFSCEITELRYDDEDGFGMGAATEYEYDCKYCPDCGAKTDGGANNEKTR